MLLWIRLVRPSGGGGEEEEEDRAERRSAPVAHAMKAPQQESTHTGIHTNDE